MSIDGLSVFALVPARGGSKGIPGKNLRPVAGLSLIGHTAKVLKQLDWLDAALLSTDDDAIAAEGLRHGLEVPFRRPAELAGDDARSVDVWRHAWLAAEELHGRRYELSILAEPTSPLRRVEDMTVTIRALIDSQASAAATISPTPAHFSPHKTLTIGENGRIGFYLSEGAGYANRHSIPRYYHRNGACYAARRISVVERLEIINRDAVPVVIDRPLVNIDDPLDLEWAEFLMRREGVR